MLMRSIILVSALALAGCITTDEKGKPIPHEVRNRGKTTPIDAAMANATLDGSRVVASGKPPIAFLYPGTGRLTVRDLNTNYIPFSIEPTAEPGAKVLISLTADGKVTGTASGENGQTVNEVAYVDKSHVFVITYQATTAAVPAPQQR